MGNFISSYHEDHLQIVVTEIKWIQLPKLYPPPLPLPMPTTPNNLFLIIFFLSFLPLTSFFPFWFLRQIVSFERLLPNNKAATTYFLLVSECKLLKVTYWMYSDTAKSWKFYYSIHNFLNKIWNLIVPLHKKWSFKYDQILKKLRICSLLLKKSVTENFIFSAVFPQSLVFIRAQSCLMASKLTYTKLTLKHKNYC